MAGRAVRACLALALTAGVAHAAEDPLRTVARKLLETHNGALVTVKLVLKRRMVVQGQERGSSESQSEILGTVISPEGLTVVSDSDSNPFTFFGDDDEDGPSVDTDTSDVKILMPDGREIPARFVLRDRDLDLAFVQPEAGDVKLPYLDLGGGAVPRPLDDLIFLYRAGKNLNREACVSISSVRAVVRRPRTFVVTDWLEALEALGGPAFDSQGSFVGMVVLRRTPTPDQSRGPIRGPFDAITPVVLTVADLKAVAAEAARAAGKSTPR